MDNKNLFSIGEIAKAVGITRKIILNYEAKGLIQPDKKTEPPATDTTLLIPLLRFVQFEFFRIWGFLLMRFANTSMTHPICSQ